jgi:hypothetical protein
MFLLNPYESEVDVIGLKSSLLHTLAVSDHPLCGPWKYVEARTGFPKGEQGVPEASSWYVVFCCP